MESTWKPFVITLCKSSQISLVTTNIETSIKTMNKDCKLQNIFKNGTYHQN